MDYYAFLEELRKYTKNTANIKVANVAGSLQSPPHSGVTSVPEPFIGLLQFVLPSLQTSITNGIASHTDSASENGPSEDNKHLCMHDEVIVLTDLQTPSFTFSPTDHLIHYCCTLDYIVCSKEEYEAGNYADKLIEGIAIDFTLGQVLSGGEFLNAVLTNQSVLEPHFEPIPQENVAAAWQAVQENTDQSELMTNFRQKQYLATYAHYQTPRYSMIDTDSQNPTAPSSILDEQNPTSRSSITDDQSSTLQSSARGSLNMLLFHPGSYHPKANQCAQTWRDRRARWRPVNRGDTFSDCAREGLFKYHSDPAELSVRKFSPYVTTHPDSPPEIDGHATRRRRLSLSCEG